MHTKGGAHLKSNLSHRGTKGGAIESASEPEAQPAEKNGGESQAGDSTESVAKSTATMSMATLLSRATGFLRTWACAFALGNTVLASAYQVANNMPNMLYELVAGGILTTAFLPVYVAQLKTQGAKGAGAFAGNLLGIGLVALGAVSLLATVFAPQVIATQTFMSDGEDAELAVFFFRFFAIQVLFYGVGAIISGILNGHKDFLWPALGPVFNNIVVIATMFAYVFVSAYDQTLAKAILAIGTSLGVLVMMCVQIPALLKLKIPIRLHIDLHDPALRRTLKIALPATVFVVVNLVVVSARNAFSLGVAENGPSTLSYAWLWYQFPYGVIAVALSTAMLTEMSSAAAVKDWTLFKRNVRTGLSGTMHLIMPMAVLILILAYELVGLYHAGQFTAEDVVVVTNVLQVWSISLPFYAGYMYMYRSFSAMQDLGMVTWIDAIGRIAQAGMYVFFTMGIGGGGMGLVGIPLADFVFYFVMFFVLCFVMRKKVGPYGLGHVMATVAKTAVACVACGLVANFVYENFFSIPAVNEMTILSSFGTIVAVGLIGMAVFYLVCKLLKVEETQLVDSMLRKAFRKLRR